MGSFNPRRDKDHMGSDATAKFEILSTKHETNSKYIMFKFSKQPNTQTIFCNAKFKSFETGDPPEGWGPGFDIRISDFLSTMLSVI